MGWSPPAKASSGGVTSVTDGTHTVTAAKTLDFVSGATVADAGSGQANVTVAAPGTEIGYDQITSNVTMPNTGVFTIISAAAHTFDGNPVICEIYSPLFGISTTGGTIAAFFWQLFEGATQLGTTETAFRSDATPQYAAGVVYKRRFTPSAGSHTYTVKATQNGAGGLAAAGDGTTSNVLPCYVRFTKAA